MAGVANFNLSESGAPERVTGGQVSADFFRVFRTAPRLGRTFEPGESVPGRERVVVLSDGLWRRRFGADPTVLGRDIQLGGARFTVVGVMPTGFYCSTTPSSGSPGR